MLSEWAKLYKVLTVLSAIALSNSQDVSVQRSVWVMLGKYSLFICTWIPHVNLHAALFHRGMCVYIHTFMREIYHFLANGIWIFWHCIFYVVLSFLPIWTYFYFFAQIFLNTCNDFTGHDGPCQSSSTCRS